MSDDTPTPANAGRYTIHAELGRGGMAHVYLGQLVGPLGFNKLVAIKRILPRYARDERFLSRFVDEAWVATRVLHPNVVQTLDVVVDQREVFIVMEYVRGVALSRLLAAGGVVPSPIAVAIACDVLSGLHAAHEAKDENGAPLSLVHRDVSPQNVIVGTDGVARLMDFGIAKADNRVHLTEGNLVIGKLRYMPPEQAFGDAPVDRRADVYAVGVVLWEALAGRRLFDGKSIDDLVAFVAAREVPSIRGRHPDASTALDAALQRALDHVADARFETASAFRAALVAASPIASPLEVAEWVARAGATDLAEARSLVDGVERGVRSTRAVRRELEALVADPSGVIEADDTIEHVPSFTASDAVGRNLRASELPTAPGVATLASTQPASITVRASSGSRRAVWAAMGVAAVLVATAVLLFFVGQSSTTAAQRGVAPFVGARPLSPSATNEPAGTPTAPPTAPAQTTPSATPRAAGTTDPIRSSRPSVTRPPPSSSVWVPPAFL